MSSYVPANLRRKVVERAERLCEYCLIHEDDTFLGCEVEHIISEKHKGLTVESNLALACVFCNRAKGSDIASISPTTRSITRLYNPRSDIWSEHFRLENLHIVGLTAIGEATVELLDLNHPDRILERETLSAVERYPTEAARRRIAATQHG
jgi:hypothetical protein